MHFYWFCSVYQGDGRPFWRLVVSEATGCADHDYFEEVYQVKFLETRMSSMFSSIFPFFLSISNRYWKTNDVGHPHHIAFDLSKNELTYFQNLLSALLTSQRILEIFLGRLNSFRLVWELPFIYQILVLVGDLNELASQYYADGNAWHLPAGAYETMSTLKDAGGHIHQVFFFIFC